GMFIDELRRKVPPEDQHLEYKSVMPPSGIIAREISAFANADGGKIVFGVDEDLHIRGIQDDVPVESLIESAVNRIQPRPAIVYYAGEINGKRTYVLEVGK